MPHPGTCAQSSATCAAAHHRVAGGRSWRSFSRMSRLTFSPPTSARVAPRSLHTRYAAAAQAARSAPVIRPRLAGAKKSPGATVPAMMPRKRLVPAGSSRSAATRLVISGGRRGQPRHVGGHCVDRPGEGVAPAAEVGQRSSSGPRSAEPVDDRPRQNLGVEERIGHALRGDRVLVVARVAEERPARARRGAEKAVGVAGSDEASDLARRGETVGERRGSCRPQHDTPTPRRHAPGRSSARGQATPRKVRPSFVGAATAEKAVADEELAACDRQAVPVGVPAATRRRRRIVGRRPDPGCEARAFAVGADDQPRLDVLGLAARRRGADADNPPARSIGAAKLTPSRSSAPAATAASASIASKT